MREMVLLCTFKHSPEALLLYELFSLRILNVCTHEAQPVDTQLQQKAQKARVC